MDQHDLNKSALLNFLGYGNPVADAVFIGMEEGFTEGIPLVDQLRVRSTFAPLVDMHEAARAHSEKYFTGGRPPIQKTWNLIIRLLLALDGNISPTNDEIRYYQRDRLGRSNERGALLELLPLPAVGLHEWPYAHIFEAFATRHVYRANLLTTRICQLRDHLQYGPRLVVCYGKGYWTYFKALFPRATWSAAGPFEKTTIEKTTVILSPHFTSRQMNGKRELLLQLFLQSTNVLKVD